MYFLIDFENVQKGGFAGAHFLNKKDTLIIFFSEQCKILDGCIFAEIRKSKCKVEVRKLVKAGSNALDFYIATETGRIFGSGYSGELAIVSKDNGFNAIVDYWSMEGQGNRTVVVGPTLESCMLLSKTDESRIRAIKEEHIPIVLDVFLKESPREEQKPLAIKDLYKGTPYESHSEKIEAFVLCAHDKPSIYQSIIKEFGMNPGIEIYKYIKPLVKTLDLPPFSSVA